MKTTKILSVAFFAFVFGATSGKMNASDIAKAIKMSGGKATMKTVSGGTLTAWMKGEKLYITDEKGWMSEKLLLLT